MEAGSNVAVSLTPGFSSSTYTEYWKVWIDYNKNGDFTDPGEEVYSGVSTGTVSGILMFRPEQPEIHVCVYR